MNDRIDIDKLTDIALEAGQKIMSIYERGFDVTQKEDRTPLTDADRASHEFIKTSLHQLTPNLPILSEEGKHTSFDERKRWDRFWMVDPLDGTKEFIKRKGDFTVNIALVQANRPVLGIVYAPAKKVLYRGQVGAEAEKIENGSTEPLNPAPFPEHGDGLNVAVSSSHPSAELEDYLKTIKIKNRISIGSALKLCYVADGRADLYPRFGPTMEWDTAAAHAILNAVGKRVMEFGKDRELRYNKKDLLNPWFIAR